MGVPDFFTFISRSAPGAIQKLPTNTSSPLVFDFVLIDATNASQTIGFEKLFDFLCNPALRITRAILFALDSQRDRSGSRRHQRQSLLYVGDLDVKVEQLCTRLHAALQKSGRYGTAALPVIGMSGRRTLGEGDYKLLDLHRKIVAGAAASGTEEDPSFLFVSEDSDVLCGLLCGPSPAACSIATNLHDTVFNLCILRLENVLAYVAECVEALLTNDSEDTSGAEARAPMQEAAVLPGQAVDTHTRDAEKKESVEKGEEEEKDDDTNTVRRRKKDGPMTATGVRTVLSDSDDDDENDNGGGVDAKAATTTKKESESATDTRRRGDVAAAVALKQPAKSIDVAAASIVQNSCLDLVFLFVIVMGNELNVPSLMRGATKVDILACWQSYCKKKYWNTFGEEKAMGRSLLTCVEGGGGAASGGEMALRLDFKFLHNILESVHYSDTLSRPPVEDEMNRALQFISDAVYSTARYMVGCNVASGVALTESLLDSRPLGEAGMPQPPNLAALFWVLGQSTFHTFTFPLTGSSPSPSQQQQQQRGAAEGSKVFSRPGVSSENARMQLDVGESLTFPVQSAASWAVRGAGKRSYRLTDIITGSTHAAPAAVGGRALARASGLSYTDAIKACLARWSGVLPAGASEPRGTFLMIHRFYHVTIVLALPRLREVAALAKVKGKGLEPAASAGAVSAAGDAVAPTAYAYSFELRRMTPVLKSAPESGVAEAGQQQKAIGGDGSTGSGAVGSGGARSARDLLMSAMGISLSYAKSGPGGGAAAPRDVIRKVTRQELDEEDRAEFDRLNKVAKLEREKKKEVLRATAKAGGGAKKGTTAEDGHGAAEAAAKKKKKPRLGKKERQKLQKQDAPAGGKSE